MLVVLGCYLTEAGKIIKEEMLYHLKTHNVFCVNQNPPGKLFEYPAIKCAAKMSIDMNEPVLYLHTKGSGNPIPNYMFNKVPLKSIADLKPIEAKYEDWQSSVRKLWYDEFTTNKINLYLNEVNTNDAIVACPFTGKGKSTWQNGFILNPLAAKKLLPNLKLTSNRDYYEHIFEKFDDIKVKGIIFNDIDKPLNDNIYKMRNYIWSYWNK